MKNCTASDICLLILSASIPLALLEIFLNRLIGGYAMSDNAAGIINNLLHEIGGGVIAIISYKFGKDQIK